MKQAHLNHQPKNKDPGHMTGIALIHSGILYEELHLL